MRAYLLTAPVWVRSLLMGALFGISFGIFAAVDPDFEDGWRAVLLVGLVSGALFGTLMGFAQGRQLRATRAILVDLSRAQQTAAIRAARRGGAPDDRAVRRAALELSQDSHRALQRAWPWPVVLPAGWVVLSVGFAFARSPWWWLAVIVFGTSAVSVVRTRGRLERQLHLLSSGELTQESLRSAERGGNDASVMAVPSRDTVGPWFHALDEAPHGHDDDAASGRPDTVSLWIYPLAAPVVILMGVSLVRDPGRIGQAASVSGNVTGILVIAAILSAVLAGVWALSMSRFRTSILAVQVAVIWVGGLLYAFEVRTEVTGWDVAEDAALLATTLAQVIPRRRSSS